MNSILSGQESAHGLVKGERKRRMIENEVGRDKGKGKKDNVISSSLHAFFSLSSVLFDEVAKKFYLHSFFTVMFTGCFVIGMILRVNRTIIIIFWNHHQKSGNKFLLLHFILLSLSLSLFLFPPHSMIQDKNERGQRKKEREGSEGVKNPPSND